LNSLQELNPGEKDEEAFRGLKKVKTGRSSELLNFKKTRGKRRRNSARMAVFMQGEGNKKACPPHDLKDRKGIILDE